MALLSAGERWGSFALSVCVCDYFLWCLPLLKVSSPIEISNTHLVTEADAITDDDADAQREWIFMPVFY